MGAGVTRRMEIIDIYLYFSTARQYGYVCWNCNEGGDGRISSPADEDCYFLCVSVRL